MRAAQAMWLAAFGLLTCSFVAHAAPLQVAVSVPPQAYFVERIAGPLVAVEVLMPPGVSHETYTPAPRQLVALSKARLYVKVGHPNFTFEAQHINPYLAAHPEITVVNMSEGLRYIDMPAHSHDEHEHAAAGESVSDSHVWVSPDAVALAVRNIARALIAVDPVNRAAYEANLAAFLQDIATLDADIRATLANVKQRRFMVYHPAWGYLAAQYGLEQVAIEAAGKTPSPERLAALIDSAKQQGIRVIFVQSGFSQKSADIIAREIHAQVVALDPLARDWLANLRAVAAAFKQAMDTR